MCFVRFARPAPIIQRGIFWYSVYRHLRLLVSPALLGDLECFINNKIENYVTHSEQMKKCIQYVYKQHVIRAKASAQSLPEDIENTIRNEYTEFLIDCCQLFIEYKELIKNKFKNNSVIL